MKYGETFSQRSPPEWEAYNVDYNEIKAFIKKNTTNPSRGAIDIPGKQSPDELAKGFESELYDELASQHQRVDLFVRSKTGEVRRRLNHLEKIALHLQNHPQVTAQTKISVRRLEKFSRLETEIIRVGDQIQALARFTGAQRLAFRKLLKKYRKWTGSGQLESRFNHNVTSKPKAFENQDLNPLLLQYNELLAAVRAPFEAGMTWSAKNEELLGEDQRGSDDVRAEDFRTAYELQTIFEHGTNLEVDTALAALPFGPRAGHTSFWIHPDDVLQLHVLLLQHSRLKLGNSVVTMPKGSADSPTASHQATEPATPAGFANHETNGILVCDNFISFAKGRSGITIDQLEAGAGHRVAASAASIRYAPSGECIVLVSPNDYPADASSSGTCLSTSSEFKPKALRHLFNGGRLEGDPDIDQTSTTDDAPFSTDDSSKIHNWFLKYQDIQPLVHVRYKRSRFFGLANTKEHGVWITLDSEIHMKKSSMDDLEMPTNTSDFHRFPYEVLEVRWEGQDMPDFVQLLLDSHLTERIPGFSLEIHAVAALYGSSTVPQPHWIPTLGRDIRKIPADGKGRRRVSFNSSEAMKEGKRPSTATTSAAEMPSSSGLSKGTVDSPPTSALEKPNIPPLELPGKKRRMRRRPKARSSAEVTTARIEHYWNEFDDGEEMSQVEAYTVLVDPRTPTPFFDGLSSLKTQGAKTIQRIRAHLTSQPQRSGEQEPLLPTDYFSVPPAEPSPDSSGESDTTNSTRNRPRLPNRYSAFPSYHSISSPLDPLSEHTVEKRDTSLLHYAIIAFLVALVLLLASGLSQITWRKGSFVAMDIAVVFGIVSSVTCAIAGLGLAMARQEDLGWMGKAQIGLTFAVLCVGNGVLVVHLASG